MNVEAGLLRTIAREPDDDAPRLVYADWLEEHGQTERADFIRAQSELATLPEDSPRRRELAFRARELLERHEQEWVEPLRPWVHDWHFVRGFVEKVGLKAADLEERAEDLFASYPVRRLWVTELGGSVEPLICIPADHQLTGLDLCGNDLDTDALRRLAQLEHLRGLRTLGLLFNRIDDEGARLLREAPFFQDLSLIRCGANPIGVEERLRLQGHFGDRVTFTCERDADHLYALAEWYDTLKVGMGRNCTQLLMDILHTMARVAIFDHEGNLLETQQRDLSPEEVIWEETGRTWLEELGFRAANIKVKRFRFEDGAGIYDFPGRLTDIFNSAEDPELDGARQWLQHWLLGGQFVWDDLDSDFWLDRTGEVVAT
ncbi:MAG: TIGR02996 domain-containing protein [Gemmataceae bacterium]|nr:TIGR02996 domain-containing protein [Gemmataceae bacterium]